MKHIADSLTALFESASFADGLAGWRAVEKWGDVVGERIAAKTNALRYERGTLVVEVCNSTWIQELSFLQRGIKRRVNGAVGRDVVRNIHFVLAGGRPTRREN